MFHLYQRGEGEDEDWSESGLYIFFLKAGVGKGRGHVIFEPMQHLSG